MSTLRPHVQPVDDTAATIASLQRRIAELERKVHGHGTGTTLQTDQLILPGSPDVSLAQSGPLLIGGTTGQNITADANEVQARNNGAASTLNLQLEGGAVSTGTGGITTTGPVTGTAFTSTTTGTCAFGSATEQVTLIPSGNDKLRLIEDNAVGRPYLSFWNQDAATNLDRKGYVGYPEAASNASNIRLQSDQGNVVISANGSPELTIGPTNATLSSGSLVTTGDTGLVAREVRTNNGTELVLLAGESVTPEAKQLAGERVYAVAEGGLTVIRSDDNWAVGWANRVEFEATGIKFCRPHDRTHDSSATYVAGTWYTVDFGTATTTVGGHTLRGATAVFVNFAVVATASGYAQVRFTGGTAPTASVINYGSGTTSNSFWVELDSAMSFQWRPNVSNVSRRIVDVQAIAYS